MYTLVLLLHSWLRWAVLVLAVIVVIRAVRGFRAGSDPAPQDKKLNRAFVGLVDLQLLLGLALYVISPITPSSPAELGSMMGESMLRFFAVEHPTAMVLAVVAAHVAHARARRAPSGRIAHRRVAIGFGLSLLLLLVGTPWPFMPYDRPLFRFG